jgi:hypothetical protein
VHPKVKWTLIIFAIIVLVAPTLGAQLLSAGVDALQSAIASLKVFGEAVVPK